MEREYKWKATAEDFECLLQYLDLTEGKPIDMRAQYYDTTDRLLRQRKIGLRLRTENGKSVCCLKLRDSANDGLHAREEFECNAQTLEEGLRLLAQQGAPAGLCKALLSSQLDVVCETNFIRRIALWDDPIFAAELAYDTGNLICGGYSAPLSEIECEQKGGNEIAFEAACQVVARRFDLKPESRSKLSRALDLERGDR